MVCLAGDIGAEVLVALVFIYFAFCRRGVRGLQLNWCVVSLSVQFKLKSRLFPRHGLPGLGRPKVPGAPILIFTILVYPVICIRACIEIMQGIVARCVCSRSARAPRCLSNRSCSDTCGGGCMKLAKPCWEEKEDSFRADSSYSPIWGKVVCNKTPYFSKWQGVLMSAKPSREEEGAAVRADPFCTSIWCESGVRAQGRGSFLPAGG